MSAWKSIEDAPHDRWIIGLGFYDGEWAVYKIKRYQGRMIEAGIDWTDPSGMLLSTRSLILWQDFPEKPSE